MLNTVRLRFVVISVFSILLFSLLYLGNVIYIKNRLEEESRFEDLLNNLLKLRRLEGSNPLLVRRIDRLLGELSDEIKRISGRDRYEEFAIAYGKCRGMIRDDSSYPLDQGMTELIGFVEEILIKERARVCQAVFTALGVSFFAVAVLLVVFLGGFYYFSRPIAVLQESLKQMPKVALSQVYGERSKKGVWELVEVFKNMIERLEDTKEALIHAQKIATVGILTAGIAHELNNPLNNIYITAEALLEDYPEKLDPEGKELLFDILDQTERATEIVKDLLDFSRKDTSSITVLDIREVIQKTVKLLKNQIALRGIRLEVRIPESLSPIKGNLRHLQQVFLNLLLNAVEATPGGGRVVIRAEDEDDQYVRVDVEDTGCGIKPEDLEHIFEPFYTTKEEGRGTGLGLAVTYSIVKSHGGRIEVQSEENKGTTFSVYLRKADRDETVDDRDWRVV